MSTSDPNASDVTIREATPEDYEAVAAFTEDTWADRDGSDYIPRIYHDWIEPGELPKRTVVADAGDEVAGIAQMVMLSPTEAWGQGMRVNGDYRGEGLSLSITWDLFDWARERGATVARAMVFSWNGPALGHARAAGYDPATEFRWAEPAPDPDAAEDAVYEITSDPDAAWTYWTDSAARAHLGGLTLDRAESWACSELTREDLAWAADETACIAVRDAAGTKGMAFRTREYEREDDDGETKRWAEYGVAAWADLPAARSVLAAIRRDAAELGAERTRVLIPETVRHVSDAAAARSPISDEPDFVLAADLTGSYRR